MDMESGPHIEVDILESMFQGEQDPKQHLQNCAMTCGNTVWHATREHRFV